MNISQGEFERLFPKLPQLGKRRAPTPRPKKPRGKQPEGIIVNDCIKWLWANGCYVWRQNTGAFKPEGSNRYISYGVKGGADILGLTANGIFIACECKTAKGKLSEHQKLFRDRVQEKGGIYVLARSTDDLEARKREIVG